MKEGENLKTEEIERAISALCSRIASEAEKSAIVDVKGMVDAVLTLARVTRTMKEEGGCCGKCGEQPS